MPYNNSSQLSLWKAKGQRNQSLKATSLYTQPFDDLSVQAGATEVSTESEKGGQQGQRLREMSSETHLSSHRPFVKPRESVNRSYCPNRRKERLHSTRGLIATPYGMVNLRSQPGKSTDDLSSLGIGVPSPILQRSPDLLSSTRSGESSCSGQLKSRKKGNGR